MFRTLLLFVLLASVCLQAQAGGGQIFADRIEPVKNDNVTFHSPVFSPDAVLGDVTTDTLVVLKQFELQVPVEDVVLSGADGINFTGNLGSAINVASGDATFDAVNGNVTVSGSSFDFDSTDDVNVSSNTGNVALNAALNAEFVAGGVSFQAANGGIDLSAAGDIQVHSRNGVVLNASNTLALQNEEDVDLIVGGDVEIVSGGQFILSAGAGLSVDSTQAVEIRSNQDVSIVTGGDTASFRGQQVDLLALNNVAIETATFDVAAEEEIRVIGGTVCSNVRQVVVQGQGVGSDIQANADEINLCAEDQVSFTASGADAFVHLDTKDSFESSSASLSFTAGADAVFGDITTGSLNFAGDSLTGDSTNLIVHGDEDAVLIASNDVTLTASDDIVNVATVAFIAADDELSIVADRVYIETPVGDQGADIDFSSESDLTWDASDITLASFGVNASGDDDVSLVADDLDVTSNTRESVTFHAEDRVELDVGDDVTVETTQFIMGAYRTINIELDESFLVDVGSFEASADQDFTIAGAGSVTLSSTGHVNLATTDMAVSSSDNFDISASGTVLMNTDDVTFSSDENLLVDAEENIYWEFKDLAQINGADVNVVVTDNAYFKASQIIVNGVDVVVDADDIDSSFDSIAVNGGDITVTSNNGNVDFVSAADILVDVEGDVDFAADDIVTTALDTHTFRAGGIATFTANGNMQLNGQGNFDFTSADNLDLTADSDITYTSPGTVSFDSGDTFAASADSQIRFLDGAFQSNSGAATSVSAEDDIDVVKGAASTTVDTISLFGSNLDFNAAELIMTANGDISLDAESVTATGSGDFTATSTTETNLGGTDVTVMSSGPTSLSGAELVIESGDNLPFTVDAARDIIFDAGGDPININSETNALYNANGDITFTATGTALFSGVLDLAVTSATTIDVEGASDITINPMEDLTFTSGVGSDISVNSTTGSDQIMYGRNAAIVARGVDEATGCGISVTVEQNPALAPTAVHQYGSVGTPYGGNTGNVEILARDGIQFQSLDPSVVNGGTDLPTSDGHGNIETTSDVHTFFHSQDSGIIAHTVGSDGAVGVEISTTDADGNIEVLAHNAYVKALAGTDALIGSGDADVQFVANEGFALLAEGDIAVTSDIAAFSAGNDIVLSANGAAVLGDTTNIEVHDALLLQQYGTTGTGGIAMNVGSDFTATVNDGRMIHLTSSSSLDLVADRFDARFTSTNGPVNFDADLGTLSFLSEGGLTVDTTEGPIDIVAGGANGSVTVEGEDWEFTSDQGAIHMFSQRETTITAGDDFNVNADVTAPAAPGHCLLIQTERPNDSVILSGDNRIRIDASADLSDVDALLIAGNNIDMEDNDSIVFTIQDLFEVGTTQSPGGEPSYQPLVRVVAGGAAGAPGVVFAAADDFDIETVNTLNTESTAETTVTATEAVAFDSNGSVHIVSQATAGATADATFTSAADINVSGTVVTQTAPANYLVTAIDNLFIESSGTDIGDRLEFTTEEVTATADSFVVDTDVHTNDIEGMLTFAADAGSLSISNEADAARGQFDDAEHGTITFAADGDFVAVSAADSISFTQAIRDGRLKVTAEDFDIDTTNDFLLNASSDDSNVRISSAEIDVDAATSLTLLTATTGNTYYYNSPNSLPQDQGDIVFTADAVELMGVDLTMAANGNFSIEAVEGSVLLSAGTDFDIDFGAPDADSNSGLYISSTDAVDVTAANALTIAPALNMAIAQYEDGVGYVFVADEDLLIQALTEVIADAEEIFHFSEELTVVSPEMTVTPGDGLFIIAQGHGSTVDITAAAPSTFSTTAIIEFLTDGGEVRLEADDATLTGNDQVTFQTEFGDVRLEGEDDIIMEAVDALFEAQGHDASGEAGIRILSAAEAIFEATDMFLDGREFVEAFASTDITFTADELEIYAFNTECDLEISAGESIILSSTNTLISGTNLEITADNVDIDAEDFEVLTFLDQTDIYFTVNEPGVTNGGEIELVTPLLDITAGRDFVVRAGDNDGSGNLALNNAGQVTVSATQADLDAPITDAAFQAVADAGSIRLRGETLNMSPRNFLAQAAETRVNVPGGDLTFTSDGTFTIESDHGRVRVLDSGASGLTLSSANNVLLETVGYGLQNDIIVTSQRDLLIEAPTLDFQATGSDGSITLKNEAFGTNDLVVDDTMTVDADSGIRFLRTNNANSPMTFSSADNIDITTMDLLDDIFFQSDFRTSFIATSANRKISHTNYNYRLGFFSVNPAHVRHVQYQTSDGCVSGGWCGFTFPESVGSANGAISNIALVAEILRGHLRNFGLIAWKHPTV